MALVPLDTWYIEGQSAKNFVTGTENPLIPTLGPVYWTRDQINAWSTGSVFTELLGSYVANNWTPTVFGTSITTSGEMDDFHEESIRCLGSAIIYAVNTDAGHLSDAQAYLVNCSEITSISVAVGQDNLEMSWAICNMVRAAWVIEYYDPDFETFLRDIAWPLCDWTNGGNFWASMAAARLMIASYLEDGGLWADAMNMTQYRIARTIFHSDYDGGNIKPLMGFYLWPAHIGDSTPHESATEQHWWNLVSHPVYAATFGGNPLDDGTDAETTRDLGHEAMGMTGWVMAALTIQAAGRTVPDEVMDRIRANVIHVATRVNHYIDNGTLLTPAGTQTSPTGVGSIFNYGAGYYAAARLLDADMPAELTALLLETPIANSFIVGINHQTFDRYCDGTLL